VLGLLQRVALRRLERAFETGRILPYLVGVVALIAVLFGVIMRVVDSEDFPSLGVALWWAVTNVTTVGYGDVVPEQPVGRAVAAGLMVVGFASLSLLAGIIASALIARRAASEPDEALAALERLERRLDEIERLVRER
jgi:voltage-gated potassium channel Kch